MNEHLKNKVRVIGNKDLEVSSSRLTLEALVRDKMLPQLKLLTKWHESLRTPNRENDITQLLIDVCAWARTVIEACKRTGEDKIIAERNLMVGTLGSCMRADASKLHRLVCESELLKLVLIDEAGMVPCGDGVGGLTLLHKALDLNARLVLLGDASQEGPMPWTTTETTMPAKHDGNASLLQYLLERYPGCATVRASGRRLRKIVSTFVTELSHMVLGDRFKEVPWPELTARPPEQEDETWPEIQATLAAP